MDKNLSNRYKQLIGESIAEDKKPLLYSDNVTDEKLAERLAESELSKEKKKELEEEENKELSEGWDETSKSESKEMTNEEDCDCGDCPDCKEKESINESKDIVYNLTFLK